jgi:hypothetical protein
MPNLATRADPNESAPTRKISFPRQPYENAVAGRGTLILRGSPKITIPIPISVCSAGGEGGVSTRERGLRRGFSLTFQAD